MIFFNVERFNHDELMIENYSVKMIKNLSNYFQNRGIQHFPW
jgi:hypothetical protein